MIKQTESICPTCNLVVPAKIYEDDGKVYIAKTCPEHGEFTDLYWGDYGQYIRAEKYSHVGQPINNPRTHERKGCPFDCGTCTNHKSSTILGIIDVTNRCNLRCPICFAYAGAAGYLYEPSKQQIREMMMNLRENRPIKTPALLLSGGEPTVRDDLPELIAMAKELGFGYVMVASNGIRMAESPEYCKKLKAAGLDNVYLQFDGVTPAPYIEARGFDLLPIKLRAIENLRQAGFFALVLVPVLVKGVNDDQVGDIVRFALENSDCVKGVNFQPVSISGRIDRSKREAMRNTIPDLMRLMEEQTNGFIEAEDWYPVPVLQPLSEFLSLMKEEPYVDFCCHPHCGMGTYLVMEKDGVKPITDVLNVDNVLEVLEKSSKKMEKGKNIGAKVEVVGGVINSLKFSTLAHYLKDLVITDNFNSLNRAYHQRILVSAMHFMDPYNFDLERVQRCVIHYATPDGRIIPFCAMNNIHREEIEKKFSKPIKESETTPLCDVDALTKRIKEEHVPEGGRVRTEGLI